jgi:hypothetical protein
MYFHHKSSHLFACYSSVLWDTIISISLGYDLAASSKLNNKTRLLVGACSSGNSCTEGAISRGLQYMICRAMQSALKLTHVGLRLFPPHIPPALSAGFKYSSENSVSTGHFVLTQTRLELHSILPKRENYITRTTADTSNSSPLLFVISKLKLN